jgi:hypothetical protein
MHVVFLDIGVENVTGKIQIDWPGLSRPRNAKRSRDVFRYPLGRVDAFGELRDRLHDGKLVDLLE